MTSDTAAALFLAASAWAIWTALERLTLGRVLLSALIMGALFLTKMSALLIVPVALLLVGARLADGRPLGVSLGGFRRELASRAQQAMAVCAAALVHAFAVVAIVWAGLPRNTARRRRSERSWYRAHSFSFCSTSASVMSLRSSVQATRFRCIFWPQVGHFLVAFGGGSSTTPQNGQQTAGLESTTALAVFSGLVSCDLWAATVSGCWDGWPGVGAGCCDWP